jgi:hypothetical protein
MACPVLPNPPRCDDCTELLPLSATDPGSAPVEVADVREKNGVDQRL